jgi:uncharacterized RDD family membrane protein YckC
MRYPSEREPASFWQRAGAYAIDLAALGLIWFGSAVAFGIPGNRPEEGFDEPWDTIVEIIIFALPAYWFVYHWVSNSIGQSVGKRMLSISIEPSIAERSRILRGLIRTTAEIVSAIPLGLGYWWALWDGEHQTWHDKLARTRVVGPGAITAPTRREPVLDAVQEQSQNVEVETIRFACQPPSPAAGVRYVELLREGVRFEDEHGLRGVTYDELLGARVLASGDVELRFHGRDVFGRPNEQAIRLTVHDRGPFIAELDSRVQAATGRQLHVATVEV